MVDIRWGVQKIDLTNVAQDEFRVLAWPLPRIAKRLRYRVNIGREVLQDGACIQENIDVVANPMTQDLRQGSAVTERPRSGPPSKLSSAISDFCMKSSHLEGSHLPDPSFILGLRDLPGVDCLQ